MLYYHFGRAPLVLLLLRVWRLLSFYGLRSHYDLCALTTYSKGITRRVFVDVLCDFWSYGTTDEFFEG